MIEARRIPADSPDALELVEAMWREIQGAYPPIPGATSPSATPADFSPPGGAYVALYEDGRAVAGGGIKRLEHGIGEIKRMYVVPEARGRGLGRLLLAALEDAARTLGHVHLRLDTGDKQAHAVALYRSAGYREIPDYNDNAYASYWAEKELIDGGPDRSHSMTESTPNQTGDDEGITSPDAANPGEATTPPGNAQVDEDAVREAEDQLGRAGGGH